MKKWILAFTAFNLLTIFSVHADSLETQSKTVITIEQKTAPANPNGNVVYPQGIPPQIGVNETNGPKVEVDSDGDDVSCPCPYSMDEHGQMCGAKSTFSKTKGARPDCYSNGNGANPSAPVNRIYIK